MRTSIVSLLTAVLVGCTNPPPPDEVRARIAEDLGHVLHEGKAASDGSTASLPSGAAFGLLTASVDQSGTTARLLAPLREVATAKGVMNADGESGFDPDAIIKMLNEELFTDANYLGNGIYKVPASMVCEETTVDSSGNVTTSINADCAAALDKAQLRVRVEEDDGLRFWIQVDANHDEPLGFLLRHDELAITINLDDATDAMIALAQAFGTQAPNADLSGQITGSVQIIGQAHAKIAMTFDRALSIKFADQGVDLNGADAFRFSSAQADVFTIELDGHGTKGSFDLGLGETTAHIPDEIDPPTDYFLAGATVNATFQANTLTLSNISLGNATTTIKIGGQTAASIDLNPNDGRKLNATVTLDPATLTETLTVSPRLEMLASVNHALLGDEPAVYDVTRVFLDGSLRSTALPDQVEVLSGTYSIATNPAQYGFAATAGQCVLATSAYDPVTYDSYTQYSVGACN